jgi:23S rRNA (cytidine2498-2'-O)-methyltransferase
VIDQTPLLRGEWLFTTREGYEADLVEEQKHSRHLRVAAPRIIGSGLVASGGEYQEWAFARQALFVRSIVRAASSTQLDRAVTAAIRELAAKDGALKQAWALQVWCADTLEGNKLARTADVLERSVIAHCAAVDRLWADKRVASARVARESAGWVAQVCLRSPVEAVLGFQRAVELHSVHSGGRARMRVEGESPSRAAKKLEEAFSWFGEAPSRGDNCVDLGAAPGGWTKVLLDRGAIVTAVDPGQMDIELRKNRALTHVVGSAFDFAPETPVDWLFCDMVWRPLEVVALLAKWARRGWASVMIANVKLPMKSKGEFVHRLREMLREGGWTRVRARQLYHDREEVTFSANRK